MNDQGSSNSDKKNKVEKGNITPHVKTDFIKLVKDRRHKRKS